MVDAIVIGSGPNGLVAANLLADAGWSVQVLEAEPEPGGAVRSGELTLPGFVHDRFSSFYPLAVASPVIQRLELERHGLRWCRHPLPVAHPRPGRHGRLHRARRGGDRPRPGRLRARGRRRLAPLTELGTASATTSWARSPRRSRPSGPARGSWALWATAARSTSRASACCRCAASPTRSSAGRAPRAWSPATPSTATSLPSSPAARSSAGSCAALPRTSASPSPRAGRAPSRRPWCAASRAWA